MKDLSPFLACMSEMHGLYSFISLDIPGRSIKTPRLAAHDAPRHRLPEASPQALSGECAGRAHTLATTDKRSPCDEENTPPIVVSDSSPPLGCSGSTGTECLRLPPHAVSVGHRRIDDFRGQQVPLGQLCLACCGAQAGAALTSPQATAAHRLHISNSCISRGFSRSFWSPGVWFFT